MKNEYKVPGLTGSQIKALQRELSVKADGAWGPKSQAALEQAYGSGADPYSVYTGQGRALTTVSAGSQSAPAPKGYIQHASGYTGAAYRGENGDYYTDYGALLRDDGFFYPKGARISPNGMYYDDGAGWKFAKYASAKSADGSFSGYVPSSITGLAPNSKIPGFYGEAGFTAKMPEQAQVQEEKHPEQPKDLPKSAWEQAFAYELERYLDELLSGYF